MSTVQPETPALDAPQGYGGDPTLVRDEVLYLLRQAMQGQPRSQQKAIGPSEVGTPCPRKLAAKLGQLPPVQSRPSWPAMVGTQLHGMMQSILIKANTEWCHAHPRVRWVTEKRVTCGEINGTPLTGTLDCFDTGTGMVIDWKFPGASTVKTMRAKRSVGPTYNIQRHLYGRGMAAEGRRVETVAVLAIPTTGDIDQAYFDAVPYDEGIAVKALERASSVARLISTVPGGAPAVAAMSAPVEDHCTWCPFFAPAPMPDRFTCQGPPWLMTQNARTPKTALGG